MSAFVSSTSGDDAPQACVIIPSAFATRWWGMPAPEGSRVAQAQAQLSSQLDGGSVANPAAPAERKPANAAAVAASQPEPSLAAAAATSATSVSLSNVHSSNGASDSVKPAGVLGGTARGGPVLNKTPQFKLKGQVAPRPPAVPAKDIPRGPGITAANPRSGGVTASAGALAAASANKTQAPAAEAPPASSAIAAAVAGERLRAQELKQQLNRAQERILELEAEMADFSSHLMDEANNKVSDARREADVFVKRNAALMRQIEERDILVENQQQQLEVLKVMIASGDHAGGQGGAFDTAGSAAGLSGGIESSMPAVGAVVRPVKVTDGVDLASALEFARWTSPVRPSLRQDTYEFSEFAAFVQQSAADRDEREAREAAANTATASGTNTAKTWASAFTQQMQGAQASPEPESGSTVSSNARSSSWRLGRRNTSLTSHKFAQKTIAEEVEPLLRLDLAPHLSWLNRRAWLAAVLDGSLAIEPIGVAERRWAQRPSYPCVLCGESREDSVHARLHVVKVPKDTTVFAVSNECVMRLRFACDYVAFLRSLHSAMRKLDTPEALAGAWDECMRLREQMFWARAGGFFALTDMSSETRTSEWSKDPEIPGQLGQENPAGQAIAGAPEVAAIVADAPGTSFSRAADEEEDDFEDARDVYVDANAQPPFVESNEQAAVPVSDGPQAA